MYEDELIVFNANLRYWECDLVKVRDAALTDDVVEFMAGRLQKLPETTQEVLKLAACIDNQFDLKTLAIVRESSSEEVAKEIWNALQEGMVIPISEAYKFFQGEIDSNPTESTTVSYRFLHDRVQQAAYSLIPESKRAIAHYRIGQLLLQQISPEAREERIFTLVNQLNYGIALIEDQTERDDLAQLNLLACQKARVATAYQVARKYAEIAMNLLGSTAWQRDYPMTLKLHELGAEVASLCGEFDQMNQWIEATIDRARTPLEQVQVYIVKIQVLTSQNKFLEAISIAQLILKELGIEFPDRPTLEDIQQAMQEINTLIGDRPVEDLFNLPAMVDAEKLATMQVAASILSACYLVGSPLYALSITLQVNLSLQYGNSPTSAFSYGIYGALVINLLQDVTAATQFGQLAYRLASEANAKNIRPATFAIIGLSLHHHQHHLRETLPIFQAGYQAGLETGNLEYVGYNAHGFCLSSYCCGQPLAELEFQIRAYRQQLVDFNQLATANYCAIYWETTLFLLGNPDKIDLSFEQAAKEENLVSQALASNDMMRVFTFYMCRAMLRFLLGDIALANADIVQARQYIAAGAGRIVPALYFYDSLIALASESDSSVESEAQQQRIQENQARLQLWAKHAPMNYLHQWQLVEAEKYRVLGHKIEALELYDAAIALIQENKYIQEEALANELAAKFYLDWGKEKIAAVYMQEAYYCYAQWGAKAKTKHLEEHYPELLKPILQCDRASFTSGTSISKIVSNSHTQTATISNISSILDFSSLLKASRTLSGEIEIDRLLSTLMKIILENAGATKGALLLTNEQGLTLEAIATRTDTENDLKLDSLHQSIPLDDYPDLPIGLINTVRRTTETAILDAKTAQTQFAADRYLRRFSPQSLLCMPLLERGHLIGILYLENRLTADAFTSDRIDLLDALCAQAAISLTNARLYQQTQQALTDLQNTQLQLVQNEKMATLGNLVAGVAHEINNPVGFIGGNVSAAQDHLQDLLEILSLYQENTSLPESIIEEIQDLDPDFIAEDFPKLIASMQSGCDRIHNISTSLRTFSRTDTDTKTEFNLHEGIDSTILILKYRLKANEQRPAIEIVKNYGDIPEVKCHAGQLNQVFMNLLANAIDAVEESSAEKTYTEIESNPNRITISTQLSEDKQSIIVRIADNGMGISDEIKERIFEQGFTTKEVGKGTGLGMAIAHQIVTEKHGGAIACHSELGKGTEFVISLPID
ncbi:ATP-binding protein [Spirulina sp. 06S082]|nr:ATP-binding protein [Spirulina sp. 06S082]MEA5467276.1 ATP-binding protein [Spirulina sp. 06S082]